MFLRKYRIQLNHMMDKDKELLDFTETSVLEEGRPPACGNTLNSPCLQRSITQSDKMCQTIVCNPQTLSFFRRLPVQREKNSPSQESVQSEIERERERVPASSCPDISTRPPPTLQPATVSSVITVTLESHKFFKKYEHLSNIMIQLHRKVLLGVASMQGKNLI